MKTTLIILLLSVAAYTWHLSEVKRLRAEHQTTLSLADKAAEARFITLTEDYEALRAERDQLQIDLDRLAKAKPAPAPASPQSATGSVRPGPNPQSAILSPAPAPASPQSAIRNPQSEIAAASALRLRRTALESQIETTQRTLKEWRKKAQLEEEAWATQSSGIRLAPAERAKRRAEVAAAMAAKESELLQLQQTLATLR